MKDKIIINAISKIYFIIVSFFIFIFFIFTLAFILLQNGLYLDNFSISNISAKELSLRWDNGFNLAIQELTFKESTKKEPLKSSQGTIKIKEYLPLLPLLNSFSIETLHFKNRTAKLKYTKKEPGFITMHEKNEELFASFQLQESYFYVKLKNYTNKKIDTTVSGEIIIDIDSMQSFTKLHTTINNYASLNVFTRADKEKLFYTLSANQPITHINKLLDIFSLPKEIEFWANHAIAAKRAHINNMYGFVTFNNLQDAYKNLYASLTLDQLRYTYNTKLDAIHTKTTDLKYKDGVLYIYPRNAYSYGMYLDKSWLKIDLTPHKEYLTLYLDFNGKLNKDVLEILSTYKIDVPFLQKSGFTKTDLTLGVDLRTIDIEAHGKFYTKKALFEYLGLDINIENALIKLDNYDVYIPKMQAHYKKMADADVIAKYNAKTKEGTIDFSVKKLQPIADIKLKQKQRLKVSYKISKSGDKLYIADTQWDIKGFPLKIHKSEFAFNLKKLQLDIPPTEYRFSNIANGYIEGIFDLKAMKLDATLDVLKFSYQGITSTQTDTEFQIHYDKQLSIKSFDDIYFTINGSKYKIKKLEALLNKKEVTLKHTMLYIGDYIHAKIYAKHKFDTKTVYVTLNKFTLKNPQTGHILYQNRKIPLILTFNNDNIQIDAKELRAHFLSNKEYWQLELDTLHVLTKKSSFLQKYNITNGSVIFRKENDDSIITFKGKTKYKYALLATKTHSIKDYNIKGYISKSQNVYIDINNKVALKVANPLKISLNDIGIDLKETLAFVNNLRKTTTDNDNALTLFFQANNSFIKIDNTRFVLADSIKLQYFNDFTTAQLQYAEGKAGFKLKDKVFHLYGYNFNDTFMQNLFTISKFKGGTLDFSINGTLDKYSGIFFVKNTTMVDYAILNNILAFINTVPSLATFSLPGYNKNGLYVDNAYMRFEAQKDIYTISDLYINSKEIQILGKGFINMKNETIDLDMNLKTDLGSDLSKVPVVGYILLDGKSISTSLKVSGPLKDPNVQTRVAKDIAIAPLNIILRTLKLPYKLISDTTKEANKTK